MPRIERWDEPGSWHHVMNRGLRRLPIFLADEDRGEFVRHCARVCADGLIEIHAYALMTNHFHLLVRSPDSRLSEAVSLALSPYVRGFNKRACFDGPAFKDRYVNVRIWNDYHLAATVQYIHDNPVRAGMAPRADRAEWTSWRALAGVERAPKWLTTGVARKWTRSVAELSCTDPTEDPLATHRAVERRLAEHVACGDTPLPTAFERGRVARLNEALFARDRAAKLLRDLVGADDQRAFDACARKRVAVSLLEEGVSPLAVALCLDLHVRQVQRWSRCRSARRGK